MVDIYEYLLTPKYAHIVKSFTEYKNYDESKPYFNIVRIFRSVEIELHTYKPIEENVIEINEIGESIWKTLKNKYHCYYFTTLKGYCDIDFSYDMPDDVREKLKENPNCDLDEELGWYNNWGYWNDGSDLESEPEEPEEKWCDDVWVHTPFIVSFIKHIPPPRIPSPPPKVRGRSPPKTPQLGFESVEYEYAPIEEMNLDDIFQN